MYQAPLISSPISKQSYNKTSPQLWEHVAKSWKEGNYKNTVFELLSFLGIDLVKDAAVYKIPHGSIMIHLEFREEILRISAPFLSVSESMKLPLYRQILQINHSPLKLNRFKLHDEQLTLYFECPYELCDPYKIFDVLKEICIHADLYDDTFIRKFKAKRVSEPRIIPLNPDLQDWSLKVFRQIIADTEEALHMLVKDRLNEFIWDNFVLMLLKIDFALAPNGHLKSDIERSIVELHGNIELSEKINIGKKILYNFKTLTDEQILEDLYRIETFVPLKELITHESFKNQLQQIVLQVQKEHQRGEYLAAYFTTVYHLLFISYQYDLDEKCMYVLTEILSALRGDIHQNKIQQIIQLLKEDIEIIPPNEIELPQNEGTHISYAVNPTL